MDVNPISGMNYYRLKSVDFDERFEIFSPIAVKFESEIVKPLRVVNDFNDRDHLPILWALEEGLESIQVYSSTGQQVAVMNVSAKDNTGIYKIPLSGLATGLYFVTVNTGQEVSQERFIRK